MPTRKRFLQGAAATIAATTYSPPALASGQLFDPGSWSSVRAQFGLDPRTTNFATFLLAPHPRPVRAAIERHARQLDRDAKRYLDQQEASNSAEQRVRAAAARYLGVDADEIALTDSTTMGLALLYGGLRLPSGTEVLTTSHDFYSTHESLRLRALRTGATVRKIRLYQEARRVSVDEVVSAIRRAVTPETRALAVTWVHSSTGVKLPIRAIADSLASGCHKWLLGPRGTGVIWGRRDAWGSVTPTIPTFDNRAFPPWLADQAPPLSGIPDLPRAAAMTPGGFHSFEHRWALREAFEFRRKIGRTRAAARTHELTRRLKAGLAETTRVRVVTPESDDLSAGLVCFEVADRDPAEIVESLYERARIVTSVTPYSVRYVRFGPSILNTPREVDRALRAIRQIA